MDKQKKPRTIQMQYPAPYSQSWTENPNIGVSKKKSKRHNTAPNRFPQESESWTNNRNIKRVKKKPSSPRGTVQNPSLPQSQSWTNNRTKRVKNKPLSTTTQLTYTLPFAKSGPGSNSEIKIARPKKSMQRRSSQLAYPLPLSKTEPSSNSERKIFRPRKTVQRRSSQKLNADPFSGGPWQPAKPKASLRQGPDPTAPHLKYGLFHGPRRSSNKSQMQVMGASVAEPKSRMSTPEHGGKKEKRMKGNKKGQSSDGEPPMFVFRAIDPRYTRQLTVSAPTHVDIRPRNKTPVPYPAGSPRHGSGRMSTTKSNSPTLSANPQQKKFSP